MGTVLTYGTFDLLHYGHMNLLRRAKELGDYLIVGVTSDAYDRERGKLNVKESLPQRIENVRSTGLADEIIVEEYEGQKIADIQKYHVDCFVIGSDWEGKFDYLREYCRVVYLERTRGVSSTQLRQNGTHITGVGIIGSGRIAKRFVLESKYVSGVNVAGVYNPRLASAEAFAQSEELDFYTDSLETLFAGVDAVYIAAPHQYHYKYICAALQAGKHVLCEKPLTLTGEEARHAYALAKEKALVLLEALKTAYCPAFSHLLLRAKSGRIGEIVDVEASFTRLTPGHLREMQPDAAGGSFLELGSYVLLPILKLLGRNYTDLCFHARYEKDVDTFTKGIFRFPRASATCKVGLGAKTEGELVITGTKGYIYVPAPWWKTNYFEMRFENLNETEKFFYRFEGDGLRYELVTFMDMIHTGQGESSLYSPEDSIAAVELLEKFRQGRHTLRL